MACRFTYNGKEYDQDSLVSVLKSMSPNEAAKYIPSVNPIPMMPMSTTWHETALKRMLRYAAENNYDRLSFDTGATNAERYDLSKQISDLRAVRSVGMDGNHYTLDATLKGRSERTRVGENIPEKELPDHVGKDMADKIRQDIDAAQSNKWGVKNRLSGNWSPRFASREEALDYQRSLPESTRTKTDVLEMAPKYAAEYSGLDLKVGGEGMKGFYDQILPAAANKLVKKFGAKVQDSSLRVPSKAGGETEMPAGRPIGVEQMARHNDFTITMEGADHTHGMFSSREAAESYLKVMQKAWDEGRSISTHTVEITPELRKAALSQGFPMFASGGAVDTDTLDQSSPDVSQMSPRGFDYSVLRRSTNVEDVRNQSWPDFAGAVAESYVNNFKDNATRLLTHPFTPTRDTPEMPDTTTDPMAIAAGYNEISNYQPRNRAHGGRTEESYADWRERIGWAKGGRVPARAHGGRVEPRNINHNPTEAQKESGVYAKDHIAWHGHNLTIENAKGSTRRGVGKDGRPWACVLPAAYGYFKRTSGADGDQLDAYVGMHPKATHVYVVDQIDADTKRFDEHKVLCNFGNERQAVNTYIKAFNDGKGRDRIGKITGMTVAQFKEWLEHGSQKRPFTHVMPRKDRVRDILARHGVQ